MMKDKRKSKEIGCPSCGSSDWIITGYITSTGFNGEEQIPKDETWGTGDGWACNKCGQKIKAKYRFPV